MPSWSIHLEAGNRIADKLKFSPEKRKEFLVSCILPDINNGYVNNPHIHKEHCETHYVDGRDPIQNFYKENETEIENRDPIFLGYLFHLYTDCTFNQDFEKRIEGHSISKKTETEQENIKHNDFWLYGTNFYHVLNITPDEAATFAKKACKIKPVEINADDILEVADIIRINKINDAIKDNEYIVYTKEDFDQLLEIVCEDFAKKYLEKV